MSLINAEKKMNKRKQKSKREAMRKRLRPGSMDRGIMTKSFCTKPKP
jgi:ribosomal protein S12